MEFIDDLDGEMCDSGLTLPCVKLTFGSSVPGNLFGGDDDDGSNFEIVKWPTPPERAIIILSYCIKMELIGNLRVELCEDMSSLPYVRSTSGKSVSVFQFGGDDDDVTNFKLMAYYCFLTDMFVL